MPETTTTVYIYLSCNYDVLSALARVQLHDILARAAYYTGNISVVRRTVMYGILCVRRFQARAAYHAGNISDAAAWIVPVNQVAETWSNWSVHDEGRGTTTSWCCDWGRGATQRCVCFICLCAVIIQSNERKFNCTLLVHVTACLCSFIVEMLFYALPYF